MFIFTKWGTIKGTYGPNIVFKERSIEKFFKEFDQNIKKNNYKIFCNEKDVSFSGDFNGASFLLDIGEEQKENYKNGLYNKDTILLKRLLEKQAQIELEESNKRDIYNKEKKIISDAERGIIKDSESKQIYIKYLENKNKLKKRNVSKYFEVLKEDWKESIDKTKCFMRNKIPYATRSLSNYYYRWTTLGIISISILSGISVYSGNFTVLAVGGGITFLPQMLMFSNTLFHQAKTRLPKLKNYIEEKLTNRENIKKIKEMEFETNLGQSYFKAEELDEKMTKNEKTLDNPKIIKKVDELALLLKEKDLQKRAQYKEIFRKIFSVHNAHAKTGEIDSELYLSQIKEYINQSFKGQAISKTNPEFSTLLDQEKNSLETSQFSTQPNMGQAFAVMDESQKQKIK